MSAQPDTKTDGFDVGRFVQQFEDCFTASQQERDDAETARDYYDGYQISDEETQALKKRKQPIVICNRIAPKIDALLGMERKTRTEPKAYPRTPHEEQAANAVSDALKFVVDENSFDETRSNVAENLFIEGCGAASVVVQMRGDTPDIRISWVPWDRFYRDEHSRKRDFSDAAYLGTVLWMDDTDARAAFPDKDDIIESCYAEGIDMGDTYGDRPKIAWTDRQRHRVRVLHHRFMRSGQWWTCIFCRGGFLRDPQVSPYVDEYGTPQCDLVAVSAYVDRENRRYGIVKRHISPQDEINKRRSKALHLLNSKKIIADKGAVDDIAKARREAAKPDGFIETNPGIRFEFVDEPTLVQGQFQLLQESKAEIDIIGINPSIEGNAEAPSGRAQELLQQSGMNELQVPFDALRMWAWRIYRQCWYRVRQFWDAERWVRVTDDENNLKWVGINHPLTAGEVAQRQGQPMDPTDPMAAQVVKIENQLAQLDVDIVLEDAPETVNLQSEQFQALVELKKADPNAIPTKAIIEASTLRNKREILEYLESQGVPPQAQQQMQQMQQQLQECQQQLQQAQQQLAQAQVAAKSKDDENTRKLAEAADTHATRLRELEIQMYEAETARITALKNPGQGDPLRTPPGWPSDPNTQPMQ